LGNGQSHWAAITKEGAQIYEELLAYGLEKLKPRLEVVDVTASERPADWAQVVMKKKKAAGAAVMAGPAAALGAVGLATAAGAVGPAAAAGAVGLAAAARAARPPALLQILGCSSTPSSPEFKHTTMLLLVY
jgi:hypothetical protein